jgi:hypothetical protein
MDVNCKKYSEPCHSRTARASGSLKKVQHFNAGGTIIAKAISAAVVEFLFTAMLLLSSD